jgi:hypothetical protein
LEIKAGETSTRVPFLQLRLEIAGGHATGIHRQDFVIEAFQPRLAFFHQLRLERPLPVAWHFDLDLALLALHRFLAGAVARVAIGIPAASMFGIAQVCVELGFQAALNHDFGELLEQPILGQDVLWVGILFEQFIDQFASNGHGFLRTIFQVIGFCHFHELLYSLALNTHSFSAQIFGDGHTLLQQQARVSPFGIDGRQAPTRRHSVRFPTSSLPDRFFRVESRELASGFIAPRRYSR